MRGGLHYSDIAILSIGTSTTHLVIYHSMKPNLGYLINTNSHKRFHQASTCHLPDVLNHIYGKAHVRRIGPADWISVFFGPFFKTIYLIGIFIFKISSMCESLSISESKISTISSLNGHLQTILEKKQELTTRLQQPVIGDNLRVEAAYHDHVRELFPMITVHLARLNQNLETIQWSHDFKQTDDQLVSKKIFPYFPICFFPYNYCTVLWFLFDPGGNIKHTAGRKLLVSELEIQQTRIHQFNLSLNRLLPNKVTEGVSYNCLVCPVVRKPTLDKECLVVD